MKTQSKKLIKTLVIATAMLTTFLGIAGTVPKTVNEGNLPENQKTIRDFLKFPQVLMHQNASFNKVEKKVEVLFTTGKDGVVNFVLAKTNNATLKSEIEKQFQKMQFQKLNSNVVHSVVLSFKTI